jgi:hypothetical protein
MTAGHFLFAQIDKNATKETKNLYANLKLISKERILFDINMHWNMEMDGQMNLIEKNFKNIYIRKFKSN